MKVHGAALVLQQSAGHMRSSWLRSWRWLQRRSSEAARSRCQRGTSHPPQIAWERCRTRSGYARYSGAPAGSHSVKNAFQRLNHLTTMCDLAVPGRNDLALILRSRGNGQLAGFLEVMEGSTGVFNYFCALLTLREQRCVNILHLFARPRLS